MRTSKALKFCPARSESHLFSLQVCTAAACWNPAQSRLLLLGWCGTTLINVALIFPLIGWCSMYPHKCISYLAVGAWPLVLLSYLFESPSWKSASQTGSRLTFADGALDINTGVLTTLTNRGYYIITNTQPTGLEALDVNMLTISMFSSRSLTCWPDTL